MGTMPVPKSGGGGLKLPFGGPKGTQPAAAPAPAAPQQGGGFSLPNPFGGAKVHGPPPPRAGAATGAEAEAGLPCRR